MITRIPRAFDEPRNWGRIWKDPPGRHHPCNNCCTAPPPPSYPSYPSGPYVLPPIQTFCCANAIPHDLTCTISSDASGFNGLTCKLSYTTTPQTGTAPGTKCATTPCWQGVVDPGCMQTNGGNNLKMVIQFGCGTTLSCIPATCGFFGVAFIGDVVFTTPNPICAVGKTGVNGFCDAGLGWTEICSPFMVVTSVLSMLVTSSHTPSCCGLKNSGSSNNFQLTITE